MQYTPSIYAKALFGALKNKSELDQNAIIQRFAEFLKNKKQQGLIKPILTQIKKMEKIYQKKQTARIVTTSSLSAEEKTRIQNIFPAQKHVFMIQPNTLGGIIVEHNTELYNSSLRKTITKLIYSS